MASKLLSLRHRALKHERLSWRQAVALPHGRDLRGENRGCRRNRTRIGNATASSERRQRDSQRQQERALLHRLEE